MKILIIGGNGTIGKVVAKKLKETDEVIIAGRTSGDIQMDIASADSIEAGFKKLGTVDAIVVTAGEPKMGLITEISEKDFNAGLQSKLMGQVNVVRIGYQYLTKNGSFTLTSGLLNLTPYVKFSNAATINAAIEAFAKAAALELTNGLRINAVSPGLMPETAKAYGELFPGLEPVSEESVAMAYVKSIKSGQTGQTYLVH